MMVNLFLHKLQAMDHKFMSILITDKQTNGAKYVTPPKASLTKDCQKYFDIDLPSSIDLLKKMQYNFTNTPSSI